jgi:hypothetical protein
MTVTTNAKNKAPDVLEIPCTACHGTGQKTFPVRAAWRPLWPKLRTLGAERLQLTYRKDSDGVERLQATEADLATAIREAEEVQMPQEVIGHLLGVTRGWVSTLKRRGRTTA